MTIADGNKVQKHPNSAVNLENGINGKIEEEFIDLDIASAKLSIASNDATILLSSTIRSNIQSALTKINTRIQEVVDKIEKVVGPGSDHIETGMDYSEVGYWVLFGFSILLIILLFIILMMTCLMCSKNKCIEKVKLGRFLLILTGFFMLVFSALVFIILAGSTIMSGFCGFVGKLN